MARRRGWDNLKPEYRRRLTARGITRRQYEAGVSLTAARGHAATPERPVLLQERPTERYPARKTAVGEALRHPQRFAAYLLRSWPALFVIGPPPARQPGEREYRDRTAHRAVEYYDAIGAGYVKAYIYDGWVTTRVSYG